MPIASSRFAGCTAALIAVLGSVGLLSCSSDPATGMVVAISSEAPVPEGIDSFTVTVTRDGATVFSQDYTVSGGGAKLPGTLTLHPSDADGNEIIHVKVTASLKKDPFPVVLREATLGFVKGQQKLLRMPLRYACVGVTCAAGETCRAGACEKDSVDASSLADYSDDQVFPITGKCFARNSCIEGERTELNLEQLRALFDPKTCMLAHDSAIEDVNMGFVWSYGFGTECTMVDYDGDEGWQFESNDLKKIRFAKGLCEEVMKPNSRIVSTYIKTGCKPKPANQPECSE
ncbi:MAG: hypothetical protein U0165_15785 [Polyangiaceae bacterium]